MFDFEKFLIDFNIPIPNNNKNTGIGWKNISCPFCGDKKNHLGYNYEKGYFNCWKCSGTGYHKIIDVINKLLPNENANEILKKYDTNKQFNKLINKKLNKEKINNKKIKIPGDKLKNIHKNYLIKRGFDSNFLESKYKLKGTTYLTKYPYRLIIPIYFNNQLVTFQTRSINNSKPRYVNCNPEKEIMTIKNILYNYDNCNNDYCILTEGVFKVFRLGENSLASLGKNYTKQQLKLLTKFKVVFVFFDPDNPGQNKAKKITFELDSLGIKTFNILNEVAPDDMKNKNVIILHEEIKKTLNI